MNWFRRKRPQDAAGPGLPANGRTATEARASAMSGKRSASGPRVFATTVIRGAKDAELTGYLVEIDWLANEVVRKIPIPTETGHPFWNARGGNRGGRGICFLNGTLCVATATSILLFDEQLNRIGEINHPWFGGLHEIYADRGGLWVTSTIHDLVMKTGMDGGLMDCWWGSDSRRVQESLGFGRRELNVSLTFPEGRFVDAYEAYCREERLHVNSVAIDGEDIFVLANIPRALIQIRPEGKERVILQDPDLGSPHNSVILPGGRIAINDTKNQRLRVYGLRDGRLLDTVDTPVGTASGVASAQFAKAGWQRGLVALGDDSLLVGTSPATVFGVNLRQRRIGQVLTIDTDICHCVHGLTVIPAGPVPIHQPA